MEPPLQTHRKVRTGCITCKLRRVKCDETKPSCNRCRKTGRECDGYLQIVKSQSSTRRLLSSGNTTTSNISPIDMVTTLPGNAQERRYFDYFRHRILDDFSGCFSSEFWDRLVLQVCHHDPAVRHAVIAVAATHENSSLDISGTSSGTLYSTEQYTKALSCLRKRISGGDEQTPETVLICCIIFIAFETMRGNHDSAILHFQNGLKILSQLQGSTDSPITTSSIGSLLMPVFLRMNVQARSLLRPILPDYHQLRDQRLPDIPNAFSDLTQARDTLYTLFNAGFSIFQAVTEESVTASSTLRTDLLEPISTSDALKQADTLRNHLTQWHTVFEALLQTQSPSLNVRDLKGAMLLKIHHTCAVIVLNTCTCADDSGFDTYIDLFENIVAFSESLIEASGWTQAPSFSIDMGIIAPLYFTVSSCRDPILRRRAVRLLENLPRQEGTWNAVTAAQVGAWVIAVEEEGLGEVTSADDVPTSSRVQRFDAEVLVDEKRIKLTPEFAGPSKMHDRPARELRVDWNSAWKRKGDPLENESNCFVTVDLFPSMMRLAHFNRRQEEQ